MNKGWIPPTEFPFDVTHDTPSQLSGEISRRDALKRVGVGVGFAMVAPAVVLQEACKPKDPSAWVSTIVTTFGEIKPLLPQLGLSAAIVTKVSDLIDKGAKIARDFDQAYRSGAFANAVTLFTSLSGIITQVAGDLGATDNRIVKLALVAIAVARITIASLLDSQSGQPEVAAAVSADPGNPAIREIRRLANADLSKIEKALP